MGTQKVSKQTLQRLPIYLGYLKGLSAGANDHISATAIANELGMNHVSVRKDLATVCSKGKPKIGYDRAVLIQSLEQFLGFRTTDTAVLVGAGKLGRALLDYEGFIAYGLDIAAAFDRDPALAGIGENSRSIYPMEELENLCVRLGVQIAILTVPADSAQSVCDRLVACGIRAIWNFAPVHLQVPGDILVQDENMAASLALLSHHLRMGKE